jgi:hypothetical protein
MKLVLLNFIKYRVILAFIFVKVKDTFIYKSHQLWFVACPLFLNCTFCVSFAQHVSKHPDNFNFGPTASVTSHKGSESIYRSFIKNSYWQLLEVLLERACYHTFKNMKPRKYYKLHSAMDNLGPYKMPSHSLLINVPWSLGLEDTLRNPK